MTKRNNLVKSTTASILALGAAMAVTTAQAVPDQPTSWEKCAGIAAAGKNDCGSLDGKHKCASQAENANMDTEWVYVPAGTCTKITGGVVAATKPAK
ncbi:MAG TPA: hypothetical protein DD827_04750 [Gammaproteobacteria bacterium]|jgi:uncharacterized membrane protein|nr:hypothetical protein [Gammaproteobacteria bacterium]